MSNLVAELSVRATWYTTFACGKHPMCCRRFAHGCALARCKKSRIVPFRYHNEIILEDSTIAYHLGRIIRKGTYKPFCGLMKKNADTKVNLSRCSRSEATSYLCEFEQSPSPTSETLRRVFVTNLSKQRMSYWNSSSAKTFNTLSCPKGHLTHDFLACDLSSDCWLEQSAGHSARAGVKCSAPLHPLPPSFGCREKGQFVPYTLVCDHRPNCFDGSDEDFCVFGTGNVSHGLLCLGDAPFQCGRTMEV